MRRPIAAVAVLVVLSACTSSWERHEQSAIDKRAAGDFAGAAQAQKWLVDNSFQDAPSSQRGPRWEAQRLLDLADLQARSGQTAAAIDTYREILRVDPTVIEAVLVGVGMLDIPEERRNALMDELVQNVVVIDQRVLVGIAPSEGRCFSYVAHEIRIRRRDRTTGPQGFEHHVIYDARPWMFDAGHETWRADGEWISDAGSEIQRVNGPPNPRYQAILDADGGFYVDGGVPGCHVSYWRGPYDVARRTTYVARRLPGS